MAHSQLAVEQCLTLSELAEFQHPTPKLRVKGAGTGTSVWGAIIQRSYLMKNYL